MTTPSILPPVTTGHVDYAEPVAKVIAAAFGNDTLNRAVLLTRHSLPNDAVLSNELRFKHFLPSITDKAEVGSVLLEAGNCAAVAVWVPPGVPIPPLSPSVVNTLIREYKDKWSKAIDRILGDRQYWYLNYLGRDPERNEKGAIRALISPFLQQGQEEGVPALLEATNEHARDVCAHFGFRVVEEIVIGKGIADAAGNLVSDGEGIRIYGMLAEPRK